MARVPSPIPEVMPSVEPEASPRVSAPEISTRASPGAFSVVGQAMEHAGADIEQASDKVFNEAIKIQDMQNQSDARDATNSFQNTLAQQQADFLQSGAAAGKPGALNGYLQRSTDEYNRARSAITNPIARRFFENDAAYEVRQNVARASAYSNQQMRLNNIASQSAAIENAGTDTRMHPADQGAVDHNIEIVQRATELTMANKGYEDPNDPVVKSAVLKATSAIYRQQIVGLAQASGDPAKAYQLEQDYERRGLLSDEDAGFARSHAFESTGKWSGEIGVDRLKRGLPWRDPDKENPLEPLNHAGDATRNGTSVGLGLIPTQLRTNEVNSAINEVAQAHGIHPGAITAMIQEESGWNPHSGWDPSLRSTTGKPLGLWQVIESQNPQEAMAIRAARDDPAQQIRIYNEFLQRNDFDGQLRRAGVDFSKLNVAQQAAYLEAFQLASRTGIGSVAAGGRATTTGGQARNLGDTSLASMTSAFQKTLGAEGSTPAVTQAKAAEPTPPRPPQEPILAASSTHTDMLKAVDAAAERDAPGNPVIRMLYERALSESEAVDERQRKLADFQNQQVLFDGMEKALAAGQRPLTIDQLEKFSPGARDVFNNMLPTERDKFAKRLLENRGTPATATPEQQARYNYLRALAVEDPATFSNVKTLDENLPMEWQNGLFKQQLSFEKEMKAPVKPSHAMTILGETLDQVGLRKGDSRYLQFEGNVIDQLETYKQTHGGQDMPDDEIKAMGHRMLREPMPGTGWFGTNFRAGELYQATPPKAEADKIKTDPQFLRKYGPNPTDDEINRQYRQDQYNKFYGKESVSGGAARSLQPKPVETETFRAPTTRAGVTPPSP